MLAAFAERLQPPVKVLPATDELLEGYGELPEYGDSTAEYAKRLLLLPEQTLSGFKFVQLTPSYTEFYITNVIYETETLTPDTPIIIRPRSPATPRSSASSSRTRPSPSGTWA